MNSINYKWSPSAEQALQVAVLQFGKNWTKLGNFLGRNGQACKRYWELVIEPKVTVSLKIHDSLLEKNSVSNAEEDPTDDANCKPPGESCDKSTEGTDTGTNTQEQALSDIREPQEESEAARLKRVDVYVLRFERHQELDNILKELLNCADYRDPESVLHFQTMLRIRKRHIQKTILAVPPPNDACKDRLYQRNQKRIKCEAEQLLYNWWTSESCKLNLRPKCMTNTIFQEVVKRFCTKTFPLPRN